MVMVLIIIFNYINNNIMILIINNSDINTSIVIILKLRMFYSKEFYHKNFYVIFICFLFKFL